MITIKPKDTIYGSIKRLNWVSSFLNKNQKIIDLGCGTGYMITIPLISQGLDVIGLDLDKKSIDYGKNLMKKYKLNPDKLRCENLKTLSFSPDILIASEVLEHINNNDLDELLTLIYEKLKPGGLFLITIPNGYGLFELESFLWNKLKLGWFFEKSYLYKIIMKLKNTLLRKNTIDEYYSSLDTSPHVQRFTLLSIEKKLKSFGFSVIEKKGGSFISGQFSNLFFSGITPIMKLNFYLADKMPSCAADFYVAAQKPK